MFRAVWRKYDTWRRAKISRKRCDCPKIDISAKADLSASNICRSFYADDGAGLYLLFTSMENGNELSLVISDLTAACLLDVLAWHSNIKKDPKKYLVEALTPDRAPPGLFVLIAGPSGVGKSTLCRRIIEADPETNVTSISWCTRPPRPGENETNYHFCSLKEFDQEQRVGGFLEHNMYQGQYYGTPRAQTENFIAQGHVILHDIDINGVRQLRETDLPILAIFVVPPSVKELEQRLRERDDGLTDVQIASRLMRASEEITLAALEGGFDHMVINTDVDQTVSQIQGLIEDARNRSLSR